MKTSVASPTNAALCWWAFWIFWKTPGQRWLLLALIALIGTAGFCGYRNYQVRLRTIESVTSLSQWNRKLQLGAMSGVQTAEESLGRPLTKEEEGRARIQRAIASLPTSLAYSGGNFLATLSPSPMMILSTGVSDLWPNRFTITAHSQRQNLQREEIASPYQLESGTWDATTVVIYVLPLVILAFTYNCLSSEREQGILDLILSNPIDCRRWTVINLLIRTAAALTVVLPVSLIPIFVAIGLDQLSSIARDASLWSCFVIIYSLFWMSASFAVNSIGGSSHLNGIVLTVLWVLVVSLIPDGIARVGNSRQSVTSHQQLITQERSIRQQAEANGMALKEDYYQQHPEVIAPSRKEDLYNQTRWDAIRLEVDRQMQPLIRRSLSQLETRTTWIQLGMLLSPALACKLAQDDLCGTSLPHHIRFVARASEFDEEFKAFFQPRMMSRGPLTLADYEGMPEFRHRDLARERNPRLLVGAYLPVLAWTVLLFMVGFRRIQTRSVGV